MEELIKLKEYPVKDVQVSLDLSNVLLVKSGLVSSFGKLTDDTKKYFVKIVYHLNYCRKCRCKEI